MPVWECVGSSENGNTIPISSSNLLLVCKMQLKIDTPWKLSRSLSYRALLLWAGTCLPLRLYLPRPSSAPAQSSHGKKKKKRERAALEHLSCASPLPRCLHTLLHYLQPCEMAMALFPFYRWENWGLEDPWIMFKVPWSPYTRAQSEARSDCSQSGPHPHLLIVGVTPGCLWS